MSLNSPFLRSLAGKEIILENSNKWAILENTYIELGDDNLKREYKLVTGENTSFSLYDLNKQKKEKNTLDDLDILILGKRDTDIFYFHSSESSDNTQKKISEVDQNDKIEISMWNFEERELLKKSLLSFGFFRWPLLKKIFLRHQNFGVTPKSEQEIAEYSLCFIRCVSDNISYDHFNLKKEIMTLISHFERPQRNIYINSRDWDLNSINQRAAPWSKRFLTLSHVRTIIEIYNRLYMNRYKVQPFSYLDYLPMAALFKDESVLGAKPSSWWTPFHDLFILLSTEKVGYANYHYMFSLLESESSFGIDAQLRNPANREHKISSQNIYSQILFHNFPNADTLTRRIKKLTQICAQTKKNEVEEIFLNGFEIDSFNRDFNCLGDISSLLNEMTEVGFSIDRKTLKIEMGLFAHSLAKKRPEPINNSKSFTKFVHLSLLLSFILIESPAVDFSNLLSNHKIYEAVSFMFKSQVEAEDFLRRQTIQFIFNSYFSEEFIDLHIDQYLIRIEQNKPPLLPSHDCSISKAMVKYIIEHTKEIILNKRSINYEGILIDIDIAELLINDFIEFTSPSIETKNLINLKKRKPEFLLHPCLIHQNAGFNEIIKKEKAKEEITLLKRGRPKEETTLSQPGISQRSIILPKKTDYSQNVYSISIVRSQTNENSTEYRLMSEVDEKVIFSCSSKFELERKIYEIYGEVDPGIKADIDSAIGEIN